MLEPIHSRIAGQLATLALHSINSFVMLRSTFDQNLMRDPEINTMVSMQASYLTVWNIFFIFLYAVIALWCDISTLMKRHDLVPKSLKNIRHALFGAALLPATFGIFVFFWPIFLCNREIIFPEFIDKIFSLKSNMVMHFWILPTVCWEMAFLPRTRPKSHKTNILIITLYYLAYNAMMFITYYRRGLWPYPLFNSLYGTIYFPILNISMYFLCLLIYFKQWSWTAYFWGKERLKNN